MAILLRRAVVRDGQDPVYVDVELDTDLVSVGTASTNAVQLLGQAIAERHAKIRVGSGGASAELRSFGRAVTKVNGVVAQRKSLAVGDKVEIGTHLLELLDPPPGFALALSVLVDESGSKSDLEQSYRTRLEQTWLSKRALAWALVLGVAVVGLALPWLFGSGGALQQTDLEASEIWSAGPLHLAHQGATQGECSACHSKPFVRVEDSACQQCHTNVIEHAQPTVLEVSDATSADQSVPRCASCHLEHGEPAFLISPATDHCESCHEVTSFGTNHPEFASYPNIGRTRTMFDHGQHAGKHFGKTERDFECAQCHQLDAAGRGMTAGSFPSMCVDCHGAKESTRANLLFHHGDQIAGDDGVAFFTLPRLDLKTLGSSEPSADIGYWPPATKGGSRAGLTRLGLTEITELLLSLDPQVLPALEHLRARKTKLASLRRASPEDLAAVEVVVSAVKILLSQLAENPQIALAGRIETLLPRALQADELNALVGGLSSAQVQQVADQWFALAPKRDEAKTIQAYLGSSSAQDTKALLARLEAAAPGIGGARLGRWQSDKFSLQYRLSGHGDDFARAWIALAAELNEVTQQSNVDSPLKASVEAVYDRFLDPGAKPGAAKGVGRCTKCHDLQQSEPKTLIHGLAWQGTWRTRGQPGRALFAHEPHLRATDGSQLQDVDSCDQCHKPTQGKDYLVQAYPNSADPRPQASPVANFEPLTPGQCAQCHKPKTAASDACLQCHAYHPKAGNGFQHGATGLKPHFQ